VLFTILAECYGCGSVLISSNLALPKGEAIFKDPMTTAAGSGVSDHVASLQSLTLLPRSESKVIDARQPDQRYGTGAPSDVAGT
jgi:hypothetical protein